MRWTGRHGNGTPSFGTRYYCSISVPHKGSEKTLISEGKWVYIHSKRLSNDGKRGSAALAQITEGEDRNGGTVCAVSHVYLYRNKL